jgi:PilZ domain
VSDHCSSGSKTQQNYSAMRQDKRKGKRTHLIDYLAILDDDTGSIVGHLADISPRGIMMVGRKPIAANKDFSFHLQLPAAFTDSEVINFRVQSLWCKKDVNPEYYVSGFKFSEITEDRIKILTDLINSYGFISK